MWKTDVAPITRIWLSWETPFLPAVAAWLLDRGACEASAIDLGELRVVTSGRRAGRLLLAQLLTTCADRGRCLVPPGFLTPSDLDPELLELDAPIATRQERIVAWRSVLADTGATLDALVTHRPDAGDLLAWHALATQVTELQDELASGVVTLEDVPRRADARGLYAESERWETLANLAGAYERRLSARGLRDPIRVRNERLAEARGTQTDLVLVGITELSVWQRSLLAATARTTCAVIHAPESEAMAFDAWGCPDRDAWITRDSSIRDTQIEVTDRPVDQARVAVAWLARQAPATADVVTVGIADSSSVDTLVRVAAEHDVDLHPAAGVAIAGTGPFRLIDALATWCEDDRFESTAALMRHPDLEMWWESETREVSWATLIGGMDDHYRKRLPLELEATGDRLIADVATALGRLVGPFAEPARPADAWSEVLLSWLAKIYGDETPDTVGGGAVLVMRDVAMRIGDAMTDEPELTAAVFLRLVLADAAGERVPADARDDQVELLGWLELLLDPAPMLTVVGVNDGTVPETVRVDPFLPDTLRAALGLVDNRQRYARDAYLLEAIHRSRMLHVVTGRRDAAGDPVTPSRLLLACDDDTRLRRIRQMCTSTPSSVMVETKRLSAFKIPLLNDVPPPDAMRVTDFKIYLQCPFAYALERLLGVRAVRDNELELNPLLFGSLIHDVLETIGEGDLRDRTEPEPIADALKEVLHRLATERFGRQPRPAIRVQIARLEQRLESFAIRQAGWRREGWRLEETEHDVSGSALDMEDDADMPLRGRIDRIDRHVETNAWRIIDYKSSERLKSAHERHHGTRKAPPSPAGMVWFDLQLPLYEYLLRRRGYEGPMELADVTLPGKLLDTGLQVANWNDEHLASAIECAREVVRDIRRGLFEPNPAHRPLFDPSARLRQANVYPGDGDVA